MKINRYTDFNESKQGSTQKYLKEKKLLSDVNLLVNNKDKWGNLYNEEEDMSIYELFGTIGFETEPYIANDIVETIIRYNPNEDNGFDYDYIVSGIEFFVDQLSRILKIEPLIQDAIDESNDFDFIYRHSSIIAKFKFGKEFEDLYDMLEILKVIKSRVQFELIDVGIDSYSEQGVIEIKIMLDA